MPFWDSTSIRADSPQRTNVHTKPRISVFRSGKPSSRLLKYVRHLILVNGFPPWRLLKSIPQLRLGGDDDNVHPYLVEDPVPAGLNMQERQVVPHERFTVAILTVVDEDPASW